MNNNICMLIKVLIAIAIVPLVGAVDQPTVGAFYYPWFEDSNGTPASSHWDDPKGEPIEGEYHSGDGAVIAQHISDAQAHNLGFFLCSYWNNISDSYQYNHIFKLFEKAEDVGFKVAILVEPNANILAEKAKYESGQITRAQYIANAGDRFINILYSIRNDQVWSTGSRAGNSWYDSSAYYHDPDGRKIIGFFHWDSPENTADIMDHVFIHAKDVADNDGNNTPFLDEFWIWYFGDHNSLVTSTNQGHVEDTFFPVGDRDKGGAVASYVPILNEGDTTGGWSEALDVYNDLADLSSNRIMTIAPSFDNTGLGLPSSSEFDIYERESESVIGTNFQNWLDDIYDHDGTVKTKLGSTTNLPNYLIITSWNEWNEGSTIEPISKDDNGNTISNDEIYLDIVKDWIDTF